MARRRRRRAVVERFDEAAGWGTVTVDGHGHGGTFFHCTAIADGRRTIDVGAEVLVDLAPGPTGVVEAVDVERVGPDARR